MASNFTADGFTPRYSEEPLRSHRELNELDQAHRDLTPRYRAALDRTMGAVEAYCRKTCTPEQHDANWERFRRDGLMAYAPDMVLDHRTCTRCMCSFSRPVDPSTEEALAVLRREELL